MLYSSYYCAYIYIYTHVLGQYYVDRGLTENPGCFDVYECAAKAKAVRTAEPKRALVLSHSLEDRPPARFRSVLITAKSH